MPFVCFAHKQSGLHVQKDRPAEWRRVISRRVLCNSSTSIRYDAGCWGARHTGLLIGSGNKDTVRYLSRVLPGTFFQRYIHSQWKMNCR